MAGGAQGQAKCSVPGCEAGDVPTAWLPAAGPVRTAGGGGADTSFSFTSM